MVRSLIWQWTIFIAASLILISLAIQYPLATTFPMGGDAAQYITTTRLLLQIPRHPANITQVNHWYPVANFLLVPFRLLPISWPDRFIWWATLGQIAVGLALSWLLLRLAGWPAGAASLAFWGLTPIVGTSHFTDGTIAQLWSYVFFVVCLEAVHSRRPYLALLWLGITFLCHPITGFTLLFILIVTIAPLALRRRLLTTSEWQTVWIVGLGITTLAIIGSYVLWQRQSIFGFLQVTSTTSSTPVEVWRSVLAPLIFLAPVGLVGLLEHWRQRAITILLLMALILVCLLLSINNLLGISVWIGRLAPLFILLITILASVGWPALLQIAVPNRLFRILLSFLFFSVMTVMVWQENRPVYAYYESSNRYARLHPDELAAITWLSQHTTDDSYVISSTLNRHTEWISALTSAHWQPTTDVLDYTPKFATQLPQGANDLYIVFFLKREPLPVMPAEVSGHYRMVFSNQNAVIWQYVP